MTETKTRICPILTYATETRADINNMKQHLELEIKILRSILGKTRYSRIRYVNIRQQCCSQDIIRCSREKRRNCFQHIFRMGEIKLVRATRDGKPSGPRSERECKDVNLVRKPVNTDHRPNVIESRRKIYKVQYKTKKQGYKCLKLKLNVQFFKSKL